MTSGGGGGDGEGKIWGLMQREEDDGVKVEAGGRRWDQAESALREWPRSPCGLRNRLQDQPSALHRAHTTHSPRLR